MCILNKDDSGFSQLFCRKGIALRESQNYKIKDNVLTRKPFLAVLLVAIIFWVCTLWGAIVNGIAATMLVFISLAVVGLFGMPFILGLPSGRKSFPEYSRDIWLRTENSIFGDMILGFVSAGLLLASLVLSSIVSGGFYFDAEKLSGFQIFDGLTHGIWEEIYFRGVILVLSLRAANGKWRAFGLASALFAMIHFELIGLFRLFLLGIFWCYMTYKSRSLLPAMISHSIFNIFSVALVPDISGETVVNWFIVWNILISIAVAIGILIIRWFVNRKYLELTGHLSPGLQDGSTCTNLTHNKK